ncbi:MAG: hypothetical protein PUF12_02070 [Thermoflexaceae bacterium]|nr:hypothetical protein [Thermoflexaceae bacterium]
MKKILSFEMQRTFKTPGFFLALMIGNGITIVHWIFQVLPTAVRLDEYMSYDIPMNYPAGVFTEWIGEGSSQYSYLYFLLVPLLAALPYADSFFRDMGNHFINLICTRAERKHIFCCRYLAVFFSGGITVVIPLLLNLMLCMCVLPCVHPEIASYMSLVIPATSMSVLYVKSIGLYLFFSFLIIFIFGGVIATFALVASYYVNYRFTVLLAPMILSIFLTSLFELLGMQAWQPVYFVHPGYPNQRLFPMIIETLIIFGITVVEFLIRGVKEDIC